MEVIQELDTRTPIQELDRIAKLMVGVFFKTCEVLKELLSPEIYKIFENYNPYHATSIDDSGGYKDTCNLIKMRKSL